MCGINGALFYEHVSEGAYGMDMAYAEDRRGTLRGIIAKCGDRGRDSCGVTTLSVSGHWTDIKVIAGPEGLPEMFMPCDTQIVINNNRAEPTTEWVRVKTLEDVQPFRTARWAVSHNGVLANDKELAREFGLYPKTPIDTAVIPLLLEETESVVQTVKLLKGGFALAIIDRQAKALHLYRNFMPLWLAWKPGVYYFSSEQKNLPPHGLHASFRAAEISPYSGVTIDSSGVFTRW